jgi:hypothetical protein
MKVYTMFLFLVAHSLMSANMHHIDPVDSRGVFKATLNGAAFKVRDDQIYRGVLINRAGSMDGKIPARTMMNVVFNGPTQEHEGKPIAESLQFEIAYVPEKTGDVRTFTIAAQHNQSNYFLVKEESKLTITGFEWEEGKKHFVMSAEFNCKMRSYSNPTDGTKDLAVKGTMQNIRITVPSWVENR